MNIKKIKIILACLLIGISTSALTACKNSAQSSDGQKINDANKEETNKDDTKSEATKENNDQKENNSNNTEDSKVKDKTHNIVYYTYDVDNNKLIAHSKKADETSVKNVIDALIENNVLPKGTEVNKAKVKEINGVRTIFVDVNDKFVNFDLGSSAELLTLQSFTNSLIKTFHVEQVKLTVDGKNYSSGHIFLKDNEFLKFKK